MCPWCSVRASDNVLSSAGRGRLGPHLFSLGRPNRRQRRVPNGSCVACSAATRPMTMTTERCQVKSSLKSSQVSSRVKSSQVASQVNTIQVKSSHTKPSQVKSSQERRNGRGSESTRSSTRRCGLSRGRCPPLEVRATATAARAPRAAACTAPKALPAPPPPSIAVITPALMTWLRHIHE